MRALIQERGAAAWSPDLGELRALISGQGSWNGALTLPSAQLCLV